MTNSATETPDLVAGLKFAAPEVERAKMYWLAFASTLCTMLALMWIPTSTEPYDIVMGILFTLLDTLFIMGFLVKGFEYVASVAYHSKH